MPVASELLIKIGLEGADKVSSGLNKTSGDLTSFSSNAGRLGSAVGGAASALSGFGNIAQTALGVFGGNIISSAVSSLTGIGRSAISTGIDFNSMSQQAQIAFTTMLGSGEQAASFLSNLQSFAASTPFEFPELVTASQRLLAMGFSAQDVIPTLTDIGNAVAGLGGSSEMVDRVTTAFGQMQAKGKASSEEIMQLTEAGIPAWKYLAEAIGTDIPTAMKMVTAGTVSSGQAISAFRAGMERDFGGMMAAQSKSYAGLMSTLKDTFAQGAGVVMKPLFDTMTTGMQRLVTIVTGDAFQSGLQTFAANVATGFDAILAAGSRALPVIQAGLTTLTAFGKAVAPAVGAIIKGFASGNFNSAFGPILAAIDAVFGEATKNKLVLFVSTTLGAIQGFRNTVVSAAGGIVSGFQAVAGALGLLFTGKINFAQFVGGMEVFVATVAGKFAELPGRVAPYLSQFASGIGSFIAGATPQIAAQVGQWAGAFTDWVGTTAIPALQTALPQWLTTISTWATGTALPAITAFMGTIGTAFGGWLNSAIVALQTNLPLWLTTLSTWATGTAIPAITGYMATIGTAFSGWLTTTAIPYLQTNLPLWLAAISTWATGTAIPAITTFMGTIGTAFSGWITTTAIPYLQINLPLWLTTISTWITGTALPAITTAASTLGTAFGDWITTTAIPYLQTNLPLWLATISDWITGTALPAITTAATTLGTSLSDWITTTAIPFVQTNMPLWSAAISDYITGTAIPAATAAVGNMGTAIGEWITNTAIPFLESQMPAWGATIIRWIETVKGEAARTADQLGAALSDWITTKAIPGVEANMPAWGAAVANGVTSAQTQVNAPIEQLANQMGQQLGAAGARAITAAVEGGWGTALRAVMLTSLPVAISQGTQLLGEKLAEFIISPATTGALIKNFAQFEAQVALAIARMVAPTQVIAFQAGVGIAQGLINGLRSMLPAWAQSWDSLSQTVSQGMAKMIVGVASGMAQLAVSIVSGLAGIAGSAGAQAAAIGAAIVNGIAGALSAGAGRLAGIASSMVQGALDAAKGALGIHSPSKEFAYVGEMAIQGLINGMDDKKLDAMKKAADVASSVAKAAMDSLSAMTAIASFDFAKNSPTGDQLGWLSHLVTSLVATIEDAAKGFTEKGLKATAEFADAAGKVGGGVKNALDGILALGKADFAKNSPTGDQMGWFAHLATSIVATMQDAAAGFGTAGLKATTEFSDAASKVGGGIKAALDGLSALAKFDFAAGSPSGSAMGWFAHLVASMVATMQEAAQGFDTAGLDAVSKFSDAASKVVGLIKGGVDALAALSKYADPPRAAIYAFGKTIRALINDMALIAEQVTQEATDAAAKFATGAGSVVALLGNGVGAFAKLVDYADPPRAAIYAFGKTLRAVINDFALLSEQITPAATAAAALFAEGAGKVVGILGSGVSGFAALSNYSAPAASAIYEFGKTIRLILNDFALLAEQITQEATDKAATFASGVGGVVGIIGSAVEGLSKLATFVAPSQAAIDQFVYAVNAIVAKMADMAGNFSTDALVAATAFANAAKAVFDAAKGGLDVFKGFKDLVVPSAGAIDALVIGIQYVTTRMAQIANEIGAKGLAQAQAFGTGVSAIFGSLKSAIDTMDKLKGFKDNAKLVFDALLVGMQDAIDRAQGMVQFAKNLKTEAEEYLFNMEAAARLFAQGAALQGIGPGSGGGGGGALPASWGGGAAAGAALGDSVASGARDALQIHSPSQVMASIGNDVVSGLVKGMDEKAQDAAKKAADVANAVAGAIQSTLAALGAVAGFDVARGPSGGQIAGVLDYTKQLVAALAEAASSLSGDGAKAVDTYAKAASTVMDTFGKATDVLGKLGSYVAPMASAIYDVGKGLQLAVQDFAAIAEQLAPEVVAAAAAFAAGAGQVAETIGKAADGFGKIGTFALTDAVRSGIFALGKAVRLAVEDFAAIGDLIATEVLANASRFADGAGKVVDVVAKGAEGFAKLGDFAYTDAIKAGIFALGKAIMQVVGDFGTIADMIGAPAIDHAARFADGAGRVVAIIGSAVDGFAKLLDFKTPPSAIMGEFIRVLTDFTSRFVAAVPTFADGQLAAAGIFAETAGKVVGIVGNGVDGFAKLADFRAPLDGTVGGFLTTMIDFTSRFVAAVPRFAEGQLAAAQLFAETAGKVAGIIGAGVTGFNALADFRAPAMRTLDDFAWTVGELVGRIVGIAGRFDANGVTAAGLFAESAGKILGMIGAGVSGLSDLFSFVAPGMGALDAFAGAVRDMVARFTWIAGTLSGDGVKAAGEFGAATGAIFGALQSASGFFASLDGLLLPDRGGIDRLLAPIIDTLAAVTQAANQIGAGGLQAAAAFSAAVGGVFGALNTAQSGMAGMVPVGGGGGGSGGGGVSVSLTFNAPIYSTQDLQEAVVSAVIEAQRRGRL